MASRNPFLRPLMAASLIASSLGLAAGPSRAGVVEPLWPQGAPGAKGTTAADTPTVETFLPAAGKANGAAVVICPGGGYGGHAYLKEGTAVAQWMNTLGVAAFVLKYRLGPTYRHPIEMGDAQRALRWVRSNAARFAVDTTRVGILGFSAGGHLAATASTHYDNGNPSASDPVDRHPCRPAFSILIYPVITMDLTFTHMGSRNNLLGPSPSQALVDDLSNEKQVTAKTPPAFLVHTRDDNVVPVKNAQVYVDSCKKKGVPVEYREYANGPHGFGLADGKNTAPNLPAVATWTGYAAQWMEASGFFRKSTALGPESEPAAGRLPDIPRKGLQGSFRDALGRWLGLARP
jgi:acetyl esterase/lipase